MFFFQTGTKCFPVHQTDRFSEFQRRHYRRLVLRLPIKKNFSRTMRQALLLTLIPTKKGRRTIFQIQPNEIIWNVKGKSGLLNAPL